MTLASAFLYFIEYLAGYLIWGMVVYIPIHLLTKKMRFGKIK